MTNEERAREAAFQCIDKMYYGGHREEIEPIILSVPDAACADLVAERDRLRGLLAKAADDMDEARQLVAAWGSYAGDYFQTKHDLSGDLATLHDNIETLRSALAEKEPG